MSRAFFQDVLAAIGKKGRELVRSGHRLLSRDADILELVEAILSERGEASGMALSHAVLDRFTGLDENAKQAFFHSLAVGYGPEHEPLQAAARIYLHQPSEDHAVALHDAAEPRRQELFRRLNRAHGGTAALVAMRESLLECLRGQPDLAVVDHDFHHLLSSWFNRGFLILNRIAWDTPASILEKIIQYEAVHEIHSWEDLRRRIEPADRRCYAFFHPALTDEPLIFVEVALERDIPGAIEPLLADVREGVDADRAVTAAFYSISNCQRGLRGVSFGSFLIKQVVEELSRDLPQLQSYVTLSPMPGFVRWLDALRQVEDDELINEVERQRLLMLDAHGWHEDPDTVAALKDLLSRLAAAYLLNAKDDDGGPADSVARFHLGNGARLERINWLGDVSARGLSRGAGFMVNYQYDLEHIERNHEAFVNEQRIVASSEVGKMLKIKRLGAD